MITIERSRILLFDGECHFCDGAVQFIIKRDHGAQFKFASLQSPVGQKLLKQFQVPSNENSFILIDQGQYYSKSAAALRVCKGLDGLWKVFYLLMIIPRPVRDYFYNLIANNRYKWFGKKNSCILPDPQIRKRFL